MRLLVLYLSAWAAAFAQSGDKAGENQAPPPKEWVIPDAPALSPESALQSFRLQPGYEIQIAASEPLIEAPVEIEFHPDGRMYVLEMRGFMPNIDGKGEDQPVGRVSLLEDTNADGRFDKSTVFADRLVMPRAIAVVNGGLLVAEPPQLWFFKDTNGDGTADEKQPVASDYGSQANPEHTANGLLWGRDNWIYNANHTVRYRLKLGEWEKAGTPFRGQWGITQDDLGRLFFNSNSDQFRGDLTPSSYLPRNPNFKTPSGGNVQLARDQSTFPVRMNPGVNRGYQKGTLREDGTLARFTGACGPLIYRGDLLPALYGRGFLCEPTGNLVRCNTLTENEGYITATNTFPSAEFLASTDERFRPVNLANGPDGALYIVDMYRGVVQHRIYVTSYLRQQVLDRKLEGPLNQGRIYRVVPVGYKARPTRPLSAMGTIELVQQLDAANGWTRDMAQQLLVERAEEGSVAELQQLAASGRFPGSIHALWVLHALNGIDSASILGALKSRHAAVRATAIRTGESILSSEGTNLVKQEMLALTQDSAASVRLQLMYSLGESRASDSEEAMLTMLSLDSEHSLIRDAAITGLAGRELRFLRRAVELPGWAEKTPGRAAAIKDLARCIAESRDPKAISELLDFTASRFDRWHQEAILDGIAELLPPSTKGRAAPAVKSIQFAAVPPSWAKLGEQPALSRRLQRIEPLMAWPGKGAPQAADVKPLTVDEQKRFEAGKAQYLIICGACHQPNGLGLEGLAPPLADSEWTTGSPERLVRIVLHGMRGPVTVKGKTWELEMPPLNVLPDEDIAALLTYVRREWGHVATPIDSALVGKIREQTADRFEAWTEAELLKMP